MGPLVRLWSHSTLWTSLFRIQRPLDNKNRPSDPQICPARARSSGFGPKPQAVPRMPKTLKPSQRAWLRPVQESVTSCKAWPGRVQNDKRRQAVIGKGFFFFVAVCLNGIHQEGNYKEWENSVGSFQITIVRQYSGSGLPSNG